MRIALLTLLMLLCITGCYTDQQQYDFAKMCVDKGYLPIVNETQLRCRLVEK